MSQDENFLAGVIEGFYGPPWSNTERLELFDWMTRWRLNTYLYAPKDDLKHRALWREPYSSAEANSLGQLCRAAGTARIRFVYALSPGLDIRYEDESELQHLTTRFEQMLDLGGRHFALLFDDIPYELSPGARERWGSFAAAQCHVANATFRWLRARCPEARFLFCPTAYCQRMSQHNFGGQHYLATVGKDLLPDIDIFWTGPEIISQEISLRHIQELQTLLRRKPLIWDNLHANDYDGRRFFCGPYAGRPLELRRELTGVLLNPNVEFPLNFVPLQTLAKFLACDGTWNPREAYLSSMREWHHKFETVGQSVPLEDLILFGDCYYLPHEHGAGAEALYQAARDQLAVPPGKNDDETVEFHEQVRKLLDFCTRVTELRERPLFHALSRRVWELREELDLLDRYVSFRSSQKKGTASFISDFHLPGTYRGGLVAQLQQLLYMHPDGTFSPARPVSHHGIPATAQQPSSWHE